MIKLVKGRLKSAALLLRKRIAFALFDLHLTGLGRVFCPVVQGGTDYANEWALGAGSTVVFGSTTFADPKQISMPNPGVFRKDLVTLGGVTALVGKKRNKIGEFKIIVSGGTAYTTLVTEPPTSGALWRVWPDGSSKSCTAYLVEEGPSEVQPENEEDRTIVFKPLGVFA